MVKFWTHLAAIHFQGNMSFPLQSEVDFQGTVKESISGNALVQ